MQSNMVTTNDGRSTIVIVADGESCIVTETHPNYLRIAEGLLRGEDVSEWLNSDISTAWFEHYYLEENPDFGDYDFDASYEDEDEDDDEFDPAPVIESLTQTIERYRRESRDPSGLVRFMHRLAKNPSRRSRDQLFTWTQAKDLTIDTEGYVVGFKGVCVRTEGSDLLPLDRYPFQSSSAGHGFVDGIEIENGYLPMGVGAIISIPREEVQDDPSIGCHVGLHVGTHSYANGFAPVLVEVRFDPANVVSVPSDCGFQKLRCCEYEVVAIHELDTDDLSAHEAESSWDEEGAFDSFMDYVPEGFISRLRDRILGRSAR